MEIDDKDLKHLKRDEWVLETNGFTIKPPAKKREQSLLEQIRPKDQLKYADFHYEKILGKNTKNIKRTKGRLKMLNALKLSHESEDVFEGQREKTERRLKRFEKVFTLKKERAGDIIKEKQKREERLSEDDYSNQLIKEKISGKLRKPRVTEKVFDVLTNKTEKKKQKVLEELSAVYSGKRSIKK